MYLGTGFDRFPITVKMCQKTRMRLCYVKIFLISDDNIKKHFNTTKTSDDRIESKVRLKNLTNLRVSDFGLYTVRISKR